MSRLVVMGSGETAPTMVRAHREVFDRTPAGPAVMLDTPFAFQMNRDELIERTRLYFAQSVGRQVDVVRWPSPDGDAEQALALLDSATWVFAGPGSPTYALRQWRGTAVPAALAAVVRRGGTLVMGSAAAVTLGTHAVPVYEIYKVGAVPEWAEGLDLLGRLSGISAAVIPHFDNREGGSHDTRFCYLGELRLQALEGKLPDEVGVLGVDEHTAAVADLGASTLHVLGNGVVSVRRRGVTTQVPAGSRITLARLADLLRGLDQPVEAAALTEAVPGADVSAAAPGVTSLHEEADRAKASFDEAVSRRDVAGCVDAVLALEAAIASWGADTLQSSDRDDARRVLRALVVRLGQVAREGARDPRVVVGPYVELLMLLRRHARDAKDFATSDLVRDGLAALEVEVRDTPGGSTWHLPRM